MRVKFYLYPTLSLLALCLSYQSFSQVKPETMQQIQQLLAEKQQRTPEERKIASQLLQAEREARGVQMTNGVDLSPAKVTKDGAGNVEVDINARVTDALLNLIKQQGGTVIYSSAQFHSIRARLSLGSLRAIAASTDVNFIKPAARRHVIRRAGAAPVTGSGNTATTINSTAFKQRAARVKQALQKYLVTPGTGGATSQGDHAMGADSARAKYGFLGQGVKVAVISDSYNATGGAAADVTSGDLPGTGNPLGNTTAVTVVQDDVVKADGGTDEGRAMLQIVHDLAPKAQLYFITCGVSDASMAANILKLRAAPYSCDIIIDDIGFPDEPVFEDGIISQAINKVTASGALYFSAAGNQGSFLKKSSAVWTGDFNATGAPVFNPGGKTGTIHNFGTAAAPQMGNTIVTKAAGDVASYTLNWADPLGKSANDYDLFYVNAAGKVLASATNVQNGKQDPFEEIDYNSTAIKAGDQIVVFKAANAEARAFNLSGNLDGEGQAFKYTTSGNIIGHPGAANGFGVAAADAAAASPGIFNTKTPVESYSCDGPVRIFYNADTTAVTQGNFLFGTNGGVVRQKPDITAADNVATNVHKTGTDFNPFPGTSAAAPHAGAVAALIKSARPTLTAAQVRNILTSTAIDIEGPGYDYNSGYGIVQAYKAMQSLTGCGVATTNNITLGGCSSVIYKSKTYTASAVVRDTVKAKSGCDSIYNVATITITPVKTVTKTTALAGCASVVYKNKTYTATTTVKDTVKSAGGCDSIYNVVIITITPVKPVTKTVAITGCNSVVYKTKTYTASTVVTDTVKSAGGCDSIYNVAKITITPVTTITKAVTLTGCSSVVYKSKTYTVSAVVRDTVKTKGGCDSIYNVATITIGPKPNLGKDTTVNVCTGSTRSIKTLYNTAAYTTVSWKTINPDAVGAGKDTLVVTNAAGCADTAIVTVKASTPPAVPVVSKSGAVAFCLGDSLVLTTTATGTLQWLRNNSAIKKAATNKYVVRLSGAYRLTVANTDGCASSSDTVKVVVTEVTQPTITLVNDTLVSSSATGNQWFEDGALIPGATTMKYSPDNIDAYSVQVTAGKCKSQMSDYYFYTANTFAAKNAGAFGATLSPNPATDAARLRISGAKGAVQVMVTDMAGRKIWQSLKASNGTLTIPSQTFAAGIYIVSFSDGVHTKALKLVKAK